MTLMIAAAMLACWAMIPVTGPYWSRGPVYCTVPVVLYCDCVLVPCVRVPYPGSPPVFLNLFLTCSFFGEIGILFRQSTGYPSGISYSRLGRADVANATASSSS